MSPSCSRDCNRSNALTDTPLSLIAGSYSSLGGDIITAVNGTSIETFGELVAYLVENTNRLLKNSTPKSV
jgi:S1-C subfamily serine protease